MRIENLENFDSNAPFKIGVHSVHYDRKQVTVTFLIEQEEVIANNFPAPTISMSVDRRTENEHRRVAIGDAAHAIEGVMGTIVRELKEAASSA